MRNGLQHPRTRSATAMVPAGPLEKRKGTATIQLENGAIRDAELQWFEASGIGWKEFKVKRFLD